MIDILRQGELPKTSPDAHEVMCLVKKLMEETLDYFSAGR
jgi:hypothetical protein